jgi:hypothetical protein
MARISNIKGKYSISKHVVNQKTELRKQSKIPEDIVRQGASVLSSRFSVSLKEDKS